MIISAVFLSATGFCYYLLAEPGGRLSSLSALNDRPTAVQPQQQSISEKNPEQAQAGQSVEDRLVNELRTFYGKTISEKSTQVILLKVRKFIMRLFPEDGETRFYNILKRAFPDLADEIMKVLKKLEQYQLWLEENAARLSGMSSIEKQGLLWEKRKELFGDDADEIWSDEVLAYEKRKQNVRDALDFLDKSDDIPIHEKLDLYKTSLQEAYQNSPEAYVLQNKDMLAKVFFGIDSVQNELKGLEPEQRKLEINRIRQEMGFSPDQIERLEQMDEYRNHRWEKGLAYMEEREQAAAELEGEDLETRLKELREKHFKHEAKTIELEEKDNFFRFDRPRVYGRN
ncbi:MAG: hypothetical protein C4522_20140 [Desulfobacteraceae bacterium]|nr:MAG: hypothetical protein C4522_20140 [Desulfobacteraceae bacterium]